MNRGFTEQCLEVLDDNTADETEDAAVRDIVTCSVSISHSASSVVTIHFCHFFKNSTLFVPPGRYAHFIRHPIVATTVCIKHV
jgi:hypothetical protein